MYNKKLNDLCIGNFARAIEGKRVLCVGNAASLFSSDEHGALIDSYDFVIRFGKGFPDPCDSAYLGTRTDAWFFGPGRSGMYSKFKDVKYKIYTPSQLKVYDGSDDCLLYKDMLNGKFEIYKHFFMTGPSTDVTDLNKKVNGAQAKEARLSQGIQCIDWLMNRVHLPALTLIGFDFFGQSFNYTFDNSRDSTIPRNHPASSWHMPLVSKNYDVNPHAMSADGEVSNEQKYITSLPGINVIQMPPIDHDKLDALLKRLRGSTSSINR